MKTVNIHEAKTHLSRLVEEAARGEPLVIAKAGKPMVTVAAVETIEKTVRRRTGFLAGQFTIPDDWKSIGAEEIEKMFYGEDDA